MSADHNGMPRLIDGFPSSIEEIKFTRSLTETQENQLFAGFLERLDATCPIYDWSSAANLRTGGTKKSRNREASIDLDI